MSSVKKNPSLRKLRSGSSLPQLSRPARSDNKPHQHAAVIVDDVQDDPLWPRDTDVTRRLPLIAADAKSRGLVSEVLSLRIGVPQCREPFLQEEENPVISYLKRQEKSSPQRLLPSDKAQCYAQRDLTAEGEPTVRVRIPTKKELEDLPVELRTQIIASATASLAMHLLPVLLVRRAKMQRAQLATNSLSETVPLMTVESLQQRVTVMAAWPRTALEEVLKRLYLKGYRSREIVVHMGEPSHEILLLAQGTVAVTNRPAKPSNRRGGHRHGIQLLRNLPVSQTISAPSTFGELNLLTEEPWANCVRCAPGGTAYFWCLKKHDFSDILETIPSHLVMNTIHTAFQRRKETMRVNYPFGPEKVLRHAPFEGTSWEFAKAIADRCTPYAIPKRFVLCVEKVSCEGMYFLQHGTLAAYKEGDSEEMMTQIRAPAVVCAPELVNGSLSDSTVRSVTDSDLYFLSKTAFASLVQQYPADVDLVLDAARAQKCEEVFENASYFMDILQHMPIIGQCIPNYRLRQCLSLLKAKSYRPLSSICSTSEFCDRIILLTKGTLRLGGERGQLLKVGESVGWTCCVPHRWAVGIMATNATVEVLEISQIELMNFLQSEGTLGLAVQMSEQLMFPRAYHDFPPPSIPPHTPFYPISRSRRPNFNEPGFSTVHMRIMAEQGRRAKERDKRLQLSAPPPYRQVGSGVWIPSQKRLM